MSPRHGRPPAEARDRHASVTEVGPVMDAAARFLEARPRSVAETRRRLGDARYPEALIGEVLARLADLGYLDDEAFARAWVQSRDRAHPRGEAALRRELALKGIAPEVVAAVLGERRAPPGRRDPAAIGQRRADAAPDPELDVALRLLDRRGAALRREPDDRRRGQKAYAQLARQGFDPGTCRDAVEAWWAATGPAARLDETDELVDPATGVADV